MNMSKVITARYFEEKQVREKDFDIANFLNVLEPYYKGGEYDYLVELGQAIRLAFQTLYCV